MEDPEVVAAIVAGDPAGLAEAYDRYAMPLYSYCRSMLREPADAADAVQDTFLVATAKLRDLRDPARLRPWLYAVARNECLRRLRAGSALSALEEAQDIAAPSAEIGAETERADVQQLVRAAIDGLNPGERDVIELSLIAELDNDELADALGVSRNHAHALLSRARSQLERSLGALIVARTGRHACADLDELLKSWDGQLTVLMRKRISRHIEQCEVCGERKRRELTPALFAAALPMAALLPGFREQVLRVLADRSPAGLGHRLTVANRAAPFGPQGFPKPISPPGTGPWHRILHHPQAIVAGAASLVVVAGAIVVGVISGPHHGPPSASPGGGATQSAPVSGPGPAHGGPSGRNGGGSGISGSSRGTGIAGQGLLPSASPGGVTTTPVALSSPGASTSPATSTGTSPASASASSSSAPSSPNPGTLSSSTGRLDLVSVKGTAIGRFTLTAKGGPVSGYSITAGSALAGHISVSPSSGSLAAGASVTVTVTSTSLVALAGQLTVNPGGLGITVVLSISL
ncbi:MAG TPA: sigma-70 family RNA polymerase sigma factor [Streptosporangiaceae bacterium]|nr:sigma-70 family RNA polymerase sigma factor [Streptosporangiaceae bacterium]